MMGRTRILLTPELAKSMLDQNYKNNRKIRQATVARYANDIKSGRWNSEVSRIQDPIILSKDGYLLNGQHRCSAVIEANMPIFTYVESDADETIFKYLDNNEGRKTWDYADVPNSRSVTALARIICAVEDGSAPLASALAGKMDAKRGMPTASRQQVLDKIDNDKERILEYVRFGMRAGIYLGNKKGAISSALFVIDFCGRGDMISRFVDDCSALVPQSQPVIVLRSYVTKCIIQSNFKADYKWMCSCIFSAYEAFRSCNDIKSFNKLSIYFSQYDKYVNETRNRK